MGNNLEGTMDENADAGMLTINPSDKLTAHPSSVSNPISIASKKTSNYGTGFSSSSPNLPTSPLVTPMQKYSLQETISVAPFYHVEHLVAPNNDSIAGLALQYNLSTSIIKQQNPNITLDDDIYFVRSLYIPISDENSNSVKQAHALLAKIYAGNINDFNIRKEASKAAIRKKEYLLSLVAEAEQVEQQAAAAPVNNSNNNPANNNKQARPSVASPHNLPQKQQVNNNNNTISEEDVLYKDRFITLSEQVLQFNNYYWPNATQRNVQTSKVQRLELTKVDSLHGSFVVSAIAFEDRYCVVEGKAKTGFLLSEEGHDLPLFFFVEDQDAFVMALQNVVGDRLFIQK